MLEMFRMAKASDVHLQPILKRYSTTIAGKRDKENWKQVMREEWVGFFPILGPSSSSQQPTGLATTRTATANPHRRHHPRLLGQQTHTACLATIEPHLSHHPRTETSERETV